MARENKNWAFVFLESHPMLGFFYEDPLTTEL